MGQNFYRPIAVKGGKLNKCHTPYMHMRHETYLVPFTLDKVCQKPIFQVHAFCVCFLPDYVNKSKPKYWENNI